MKAVLQRVLDASVTVDDVKISRISNGLLILLGIEDADTIEDSAWLTAKIAGLRIFNDNEGVMNLSVRDVDGDILVVSQFTLHAAVKKGNRPSYIKAARPNAAIPLYNNFVEQMGVTTGKPILTGQFGADMKVTLTNDGPVTIIIDTKNKE